MLKSLLVRSTGWYGQYGLLYYYVMQHVGLWGAFFNNQ